jgi:hypothetical protein
MDRAALLTIRGHVDFCRVASALCPLFLEGSDRPDSTAAAV